MTAPTRILLVRTLAAGPTATTYLGFSEEGDLSRWMAVKALRRPAARPALEATRSHGLLLARQGLGSMRGFTLSGRVDHESALAADFVAGVDFLQLTTSLRSQGLRTPLSAWLEAAARLSLVLGEALRRPLPGAATPAGLRHGCLKLSHLRLGPTGELTLVESAPPVGSLAASDAMPKDTVGVGLLLLALLGERWETLLPDEAGARRAALARVDLAGLGGPERARLLRLLGRLVVPGHEPPAWPELADGLMELAGRAPGPRLTDLARAHVPPLRTDPDPGVAGREMWVDAVDRWAAPPLVHDLDLDPTTLAGEGTLGRHLEALEDVDTLKLPRPEEGATTRRITRPDPRPEEEGSPWLAPFAAALVLLGAGSFFFALLGLATLLGVLASMS